MTVAVEAYLARFDALLLAAGAQYRVETMAPRVAVLHPRGGAPFLERGKDVALSFTGTIHGTEVAGLAVLCELLTNLLKPGAPLHLPIGFAIGNPEAALKGVRFIERDLNRSFARVDAETLESRRADELERLLLRTRFFLDFHQVKLATKNPFWIFPYQKEGFQFARAVAPQVPVITHWGKGFSADGQCSDEFVNKNGGCGITMELGQNGLDDSQINLGVKVATTALEIILSEAWKTGFPSPKESEKAPIYTWGEIVPYPDTGSPVLDPGWSNFIAVEAGQKIGSFQERDICTTTAGLILFPKYPDVPTSGVYPNVKPAAELVRILKRIEEGDLPQ